MDKELSCTEAPEGPSHELATPEVEEAVLLSAERLCPHDGTPLGGVDFLGRTVQSCGRCGGTWMAPSDLASVGVPLESVRVDAQRPTTRRCPGCGRALHLASLPGLEVEACPGCSGLWFGAGDLRKLLSPSRPAEAKRVKPVRAALLGLLLGAAVTTGAISWWGSQQVTLAAQRVELAWQVRSGSALEEELARLPDSHPERALNQARLEFLNGRFPEAIARLRGSSRTEARRLLKQSENAWMAQAEWPGRPVGELSLDMDANRSNELIRVVDPGFGDAGLKVQLLVGSKLVAPPAVAPDGSALEKPAAVVKLVKLQSERLTGRKDAVMRVELKGGKPALEVLSLRESGVKRYRFAGDAVVDEGGIQVGKHRWEFEDGEWRQVKGAINGS